MTEMHPLATDPRVPPEQAEAAHDAPAGATTDPSPSGNQAEPAIADSTEVGIDLAAEHQASSGADPRVETGPGGMALPTTGELAGGNIKRTLDPPSLTNESTGASVALQQAAFRSRVAQRIAPYVGRPINEWGLIGEGETIKGHMILLDLNTGEKVRAMGGHKTAPGSLYANLRNFPVALAEGDTIEKILAGD